MPIACVKSLAARFYRLRSGHASSGVYLQSFRHGEGDKCWWCGGGGRTAAQTQDHLFRHCTRWRDLQNTRWKAVGEATGWDVCRCRHMQISKLFSETSVIKLWWTSCGQLRAGSCHPNAYHTTPVSLFNHLLSCATVSQDHTSAVKHRHRCPYTKLDCSVVVYVSLTRIHESYPNCQSK